MSLTVQLAIGCAFVAAAGYGILSFLVGRFDREFGRPGPEKSPAERG